MVCARAVFVALALYWALLPWCPAGIAGPLPTVGQLYLVDPGTAAPYEEALRAGLRELGYVEGKNIAIVSRYGRGNATRLPQLLEELIQLKVDILFVSPRTVDLVKARTSTIPIICPSLGNPVEEGLVASMVRPGGNLTGASSLSTEMDEKRLELMLEMLPGLKRIAVLADPDLSGQARATEQYRLLARRLGLELVVLDVRSADEIQSQLKNLPRTGVQAIHVVSSPLTIMHRDTIIKALAPQLPVIAEQKELVEKGALFSYSVDFFEQWRRGATYIHKILRGAKAGELPIEQPTRFELVVNLRSARALGIKIPESVLAAADEVIR